jgi:hypothetical protein
MLRAVILLKRIAITTYNLLLAVGVGACLFNIVWFVVLQQPGLAVVVQNDLPTPLFDGRADADSFDDFGSGAATCTPTDVTFVEDPASSGKYAADMNGTTSLIDCGTGLDGLHSSGTRLIYARPDTIGETAGHVYSKSTNSSNRSWSLLIDADANGDCTGGAGDCWTFTNYNTSNVGRLHDGTTTKVVYGGAYQHVTVVVDCTSTTLESCDGTKLYLNAVLQTMDHGANTGTIRTADTGDSFVIGNRTGGDRTFDGRIKRTVVFSENLNKFQVEASYYRTLALDTPEEAPDAVTQSDCDTLMTSFNAAAGQADPFERTSGEFTLGNGCAPFQGVPTR